MQLEAIQNLERMRVIVLDFSLFSGRRHQKREDIADQLNPDQLPPKDLASFGAKYVYPPRKAREFLNFKRQIEEQIGAIGIRTKFGGIAVAEDRMSYVAELLEKAVKDFYAMKAAKLSSYDDDVCDWAAKFPKWKNEILANAYPKSYVEAQLQFSWLPIKVTADPQDVIGSGRIEAAATGMAGQLFGEVAEKAEELIKNSLLGREKATRKVLRPFRAMETKLRALQLLDPRAAPLADLIAAVVGKMPDDGPFEQAEIGTLFGMATILSDPAKAMDYGRQVIETNADDIALSMFAPRVQPVARPVAVPVIPPVAPVVVVPAQSIGQGQLPLAMPVLPVAPRRPLSAMVL